MTNPNRGGDLTAPALDYVAVEPDSAAHIKARALFIGTGGDVVVVSHEANTVTFKNCPDGFVLPVQVNILHEDTTAQDIVALF